MEDAFVVGKGDGVGDLEEHFEVGGEVEGFGGSGWRGVGGGFGRV